MQTLTQVEKQETEQARLPRYQRILLATDSSDHANRATQEAATLAKAYGAKITGAHVYAAKMHDVRFRQMEGGLPQQFREEQELERQRDTHDDLISRGLSIITDSYLDQVEHICGDAGVPFVRCALEGKNYRQLVNETNSGRYDLLVIGASGLGAVQDSRLGTVCQRVVRRSDIDTLVIKDPDRSIAAGPIVVAVDGSSRSYGGLLTALSFAQQWHMGIKIVAAFDPYYHYVAFNRIASVLSEEAGKVFRFKEQEKLHEEIIDNGLAKIYQGHLEVAETIALEHGLKVETELLTGKPHDAIAKYLRKIKPSLLVLGKVGIHADPDLDIGGNAENLLSDADCAVLLSQRTHQPRVDVVAEITTSWTTEAEQRMSKVPSFVQNMARMAILRYAQAHGHTVITERIVEAATAQLMPGHAEKAMEEIVTAYDAGEIGQSRERQPEIGTTMAWSDEAQTLLGTVSDTAVRVNLRMRAEKKARTEGAGRVEKRHIQGFLGRTRKGSGANSQQPIIESDHVFPLHWRAAALARLMRVPEGFMRDKSKDRIESYARSRNISEISLEIAEAGLVEARKSMETAQQENEQSRSAGAAPAPQSGPKPSKCPFTSTEIGSDSNNKKSIVESDPTLPWTEKAAAELARVPPGFCRDMTRKAAETIARQRGVSTIELSFVQEFMQTFAAGAKVAEETMPWDNAARARIAKAPDMIRGMLVKEIEAWAQRQGFERVEEEAVQTVKNQWAEQGQFHLDPSDPRRTA